MNGIPKIPRIQFDVDPVRINNFKAGLKAGATLSGRIVQAYGQNQYLVSMRGLHLIAQSDIPLKKGDKFKAKIQSKEPKLVLKILNSLEHSDRFAEEWGAKGDEKKLVSEMITAKLPMEKGVFERINGIVRQFSRNRNLQASIDELVRAAVRLEKLELPATLENVRSALAALKGDFDLAGLMAKLQGLMMDNRSSMPEELARFIRSLPMKFDPQMAVRNLPAIVLLLGLAHESELKALLMGRRIPRKVNLKWLLLALEKNVPEASELAKRGLSELESMQLRNIPESHSGAKDEYQLQIPVYYQGNWERVDLHFQSHGRGTQQLDKNNASIRVSLDTRFLGKVSALADIRGGFLTLNFYCEKKEVIDFVQNSLGNLQGGLEDLGYTVRGISAMGMSELEELDNAEQFSVDIVDGDSSLNLVV
ncbi:MAG: flagellar hook-length control protein FliK [candidate division Zixibacteria bacterium]|nr:flagellar hook-length control protein FliK [Candidatus Tariuqbacter arcticus]